MERLKLSYPVDKSFPITAKPGDVSRLWRSIHKGWDFACPVGTPVISSIDGQVVNSGQHRIFDRDTQEWIDGPLGLRIWQLCGVPGYGQFRLGYCHLSHIDVVDGEIIKPGQILGASGATGHVTGPHLHFQPETWPDHEILEVEFV